MKQHGREKEMAFDLGIKAKLSSSETAVKVGSRATFPSQAMNLLVYKQTRFTHTRIHHHEDSPSWPGSSVSIQWEMGNIFSGDVLLPSIRKIVFLPPVGSSDGEVFPSLQPHLSPYECLFSPHFLSSLFFPSSCVSLSCYFSLPLSLHLLPFLSWHLLSGSLIILFFRFLIRILSFPLFLSVLIPHLSLCFSSLRLALPHKQLSQIIFPFPLLLSLFCSFFAAFNSA